MMKCTSCGLELIQANNGSYPEHGMYECVGRLRSALTTAEQRLSVAVKLDADDKDGFDWTVLDRIHNLESQLTPAQEENKQHNEWLLIKLGKLKQLVRRIDYVAKNNKPVSVICDILFEYESLNEGRVPTKTLKDLLIEHKGMTSTNDLIDIEELIEICFEELQVKLETMQEENKQLKETIRKATLTPIKGTLVTTRKKLKKTR